MLITFDRIPTFHEFDVMCRHTWAEAKQRPLSASYRFWGDEALIGEWQLFIASLVRDRVTLPERVVSCVELMDLDHVLVGVDPRDPWLPDVRVEAELVQETSFAG